MIDNTWFAKWFDSSYYNILYSHRDETEANLLIRNLCEFLKLRPNAKILDLCCGEGRHSLAFHDLGYDVTGLDLAKERIAQAKQFEKEGLRFAVQDMRELNFNDEFDCVANLFTSFGYFDDIKQHEYVLTGIYNALKINGIFIIDYFNTNYVINNIVYNEVKIINNIKFIINKFINEDILIKKIHVLDGIQEFHFEERVRLFELNALIQLTAQVGLNVYCVWGDYNGAPYNAETSPRTLLFAKKT